MRLLSGCVVLALLHGCGGSVLPGNGQADELVACNPYQPPEEPATFGTILAAARGTDGTLYVADRPADVLRIFLSHNGALRRRSADGHESAPQQYSFDIHGGPCLFVGFDLASSPPSATALNVVFGAGVRSEDLEIIDAMQVSSIPAFDLTKTIYRMIGYGQLVDGRVMTVVYPDLSEPVAKWEVFFGFPDRLVERSISSSRHGDVYGGELAFDVDGEAATATLSVVQFEAGTGPGPVHLAVGKKTFDFTMEFPGSKPADHAFLCRHR